MAIQTINIGNVVNDGLGDDLRSAFQKVNGNFADLSASLTVTASNAGTVGVGIFKEKVGLDLQFKRLIASNKINIVSQADSVVISSTQPDAFTSISTNSNVVRASNDSDISILGGSNVLVTASGQRIVVDTILDLNQILLTMDFGPILGQYINPTQLALQSANVDFGTIENPGTISLDLGTL
jgi:hypothetical protein